MLRSLLSMGNELKKMNMVQLTGRINVIRINEQNGSVFTVLAISTPKSALASKNPDNEWNRDYPALIITGEAAKEFKELYKEGDRISVIGHMDTRQRMAYAGKGLYRETWEPFIAAETIIPASGRIDANSVILCGEIIRVYRNPDEGKRFYMITIRTPLDDGSDARATFTCFDPRMEMEPQVGEVIYANGAIQTKREDNGTDANGRRQTRFIMSVVSRNVIIERRKPAAEEDAAGADEEQMQPGNDDDDIAI